MAGPSVTCIPFPIGTTLALVSAAARSARAAQPAGIVPPPWTALSGSAIWSAAFILPESALAAFGCWAASGSATTPRAAIAVSIRIGISFNGGRIIGQKGDPAVVAEGPAMRVS